MNVQKVGARWVCKCSFPERHIPKGAGFRWDPEARQWFTLDPKVAIRIMPPEQVAEARREEELRYRLRNAYVETSAADDADIDIPTNPGCVFLPYQRAGVAAGINRPNLLLADDPGLGKTIQVCGVINVDETLRRILIVCPLSLCLNWRIELRKWLVRTYQTVIWDAQRFHPAYTEIGIIHYDVLWKHAARLRSVSWDLVVADECHLLKNPATKRARALLGIDQRTANRETRILREAGSDKPDVLPLAPVLGRRNIFLTGTPLPNRPLEGWPIFHHLDPVEFRSISKYKAQYCGGFETEYGYDASGHSNLAELQRALRSTIMVRRLKKDVLKDLPAKRRAVIEISHNAGAAVAAELDAYMQTQEQVRAMKEAAARAKASERPEDYALAVAGLKKAKMVAFELISKQRHETALATLPYVIDHLHSIIDEGEKVVCFAHHQDVIEAIAGAFAGRSVTCYGKDSAGQRQANVERFQTDPKCLLIVGNYGPMGTGWTLTAANRMVAAELDWVPGNMTQAEDRLHRIGQKDMVLVEHLVLEGSLAAHMARTVVEKQEVQRAALDTDIPDIDPTALAAGAPVRATLPGPTNTPARAPERTQSPAAPQKRPAPASADYQQDSLFFHPSEDCFT